MNLTELRYEIPYRISRLREGLNWHDVAGCIAFGVIVLFKMIFTE